MSNSASSKRGFTLVELLIVITIIAVLSTIGVTVYSSAQKSARNAKRIADLKAVATALELYYNDPVNNFQYPTIPGPRTWRSECNFWGQNGQGWAPDQVIPGLVPKYLASFPSDPGMDKIGNTSCYVYSSDGIDYAFLDHKVAEFSPADYNSFPSFIDPARDRGPSSCLKDGSEFYSWKVSSPGGRCW